MNSEHINTLLQIMQDQKASDLYLTYNSPPALRVLDGISLLSDTPLTG